MVFHKNQKTALQQGVKFKKSMLAMCIMALSAPSFAQDAPANDGTEEVVVTGVRASLQNAQDIKRESSTVVDAISASDIGSLPDKSVLESLQRVPGVSIERFAGKNDPDHFSIEGSGVTLRGLPQTRSEFNGRDSFSANSGRGLSFQDVPPELMSKVEVFKSQSAKMIEGGISGTINLNTRKPFDSSDRQLAFSVAGNYADLSEETKPSISGLFSDRWETDAGEFGFLVSLAASELTSRTDGVSYGQVGDNTTGSTANDGELQADERFKSTTVVVDGQTVQRFAPINARIASAIQERERNGGSLVGQWRNPDDTLLATVEYVYSDSGRNWLEHNIESDDKIGAYSNLSANGLYVTAGEVNNVDSYTTTSRFSDTTSKVEDFSFRLEFTPSDELKLTGDVQYVKASTEAIDLSIQTGVRANTEFDFRSDRPTVLMTSPDAGVSSEDFFVDPANYFWRSAMDHLEDSEGDELAIKLDAEYQIGDGWLRSVETGVRFSDREQDVKWSQYNWGNLSENWAGDGRKYFSGLQDNTPWDGDSKNGVPYDHNIAFDQFSYAGGHFRKGNNSGVAGGNFLAASESLVTNYDNFIAATRPFGYQPAGYRATAYDGGLYTLAELTNTTEQNQAAYVQLNFADSEDRLTGNIGVRLVKVETESRGGNAYPEVWDDNLAEAIAECTSCDTARLAEDERFSNGALDIGTETGSFTKTLPSFNVRYMLTDDLQTRFAVSKAISFADIGNLRNYVSISATPTLVRPGGDESAPPTDVTFEYRGSGGNPGLKPMESVNYDAAVEWYFADAGSVFGGVFYKDMSNFFANEAVQTTVVNNGVTRTVLMDLPVNKSVDASITGFEAGYQQFYDMLPAPFDGLGLQLNLTLLDVSGTSPNSNIDPAAPPGAGEPFTPAFTDLPLQGMSETTYNIVGMYEKDDLSVRLAYNWRSDYLLTTRDVITRLPIYAQASGQLDGSIFYTINDNFKIGLEGSNLMDEVTWTKMQVTQEGSVLPRNYFINDRRYSIVLKGQF